MNATNREMSAVEESSKSVFEEEDEVEECCELATNIAGDSTNARYSLSSTTTTKVAAAVSFLIVLSHALLLWGQLGELWGFFAVDSIDVTVSINSTVDSILLSNIIGSNQTMPADIVTNSSVLIDQFSYGDMIYELWIQPYPVTRFTAVLLLLFSAVWPHLKLFLLHLYFYLPSPSIPRRSALYWLGSMGKLSLADICATCMLFMLLNLTATIDAGTLASGASTLIRDVVPYIVDGIDGKLSNITQSLVSDLDQRAYETIDRLSQSIFENDDPAMYESLLQTGCGTFYDADCSQTPFYEPTVVRGGLAGIMTKCLRIRNDECSRCECIVNNVIYNDAIPNEVEDAAIDGGVSLLFAKFLAFVESGGLNIFSSISFEGKIEVGTAVHAYTAFIAFAIGVILSIAASIFVDKIEEKDAMRRNCSASSIKAQLENRGIVSSRSKPSILFFTNSESAWSKLGKIVLSLGTIPIVIFALYIEMFDWKIAGLFEELVSVQRTATNFYFSIIDCVVNVNDGTGYGWTFTVLYGFFMLGAPILRAVLLTILGTVPLFPIWHIRLAHWSNTIGAFIGWEPFFICIILLMIELPSLTGETVPEAACDTIESQTLVARLITAFDLNTADGCFIMFFDVFPSFILFVFAWAFLTAFNALAWKAMLKKYNVFGNYESGQKGGPYCACRQCCYCPKFSRGK